MKRSLQLAPWCYILLCLVFVLGCGHSFSKDELKTVEGTMIEGGAMGFRLRADDGRLLLFAANRSAEYRPRNLCALHGDRLAVTYGMVPTSDGVKFIATEVRLLKHSKDWGNLKSPVTGIIMEKGFGTRLRVRLDDLRLDLVVRRSPTATRYAENGGKPYAVGDRVRLFLKEEPFHFMRKTFYTKIQMVEKGPLPLTNSHETGTVSEVSAGSFVLALDDGTIRRFYRGTVTRYFNERYQRAMAKGDKVRIQYFNLLMGDRSVHPVASFIEKIG